MQLDRDQFVVTFDATKVSKENLIATIKKAGYTSNVVTGEANPKNEESKTASSDDPILIEALARAKKENRPLVLDFYPDWCAPRLRMLKTTIPDPKVASLLQRCVFLKIDTDTHPELAKSFGVVGLPDIWFLAPNGTEKKRLQDFQDAESFAAELEAGINTRRKRHAACGTCAMGTASSSGTARMTTWSKTAVSGISSMPA